MLPTGLGRGATFSPFVPLLWLACICVPSRPTTQDDWGGMSTATLPFPASCTSLKWKRTDINIKYEGGESSHMRLESRFAFNAFYMCGETKKEPRCQPGGVSSDRG